MKDNYPKHIQEQIDTCATLTEITTNFYNIVYIEWEDSQLTHGWTDIDTEPQFAKIKTIAFLIEETPNCVVIAPNIDTANNNISGKTTIPRSCITLMYKLTNK